MRILQLTPGTGNFHCGSCLRDHALVKAQRRLGHDVLMLPMYLPFVLDDTTPDPAMPAVQFSGVNAYLQQKSALFRHTPRWVDRLFESRPMLKTASRRAGMTRPGDLGDMTVSMLRGERGRQAKEITKLIGWIREHAATMGPNGAHGLPDVIVLSNALLMGMAAALRRELNVPVIGSLQGEDTFMDSLTEPHRGEGWSLLRAAARDCDALVAVSEYYGRVMGERLGVQSDRLHVVPNGIELADFAGRRSLPQPPVIGYLARMIPGKGLGTLVDAYLLLRRRGLNAGLRIAGAQTAIDIPFVEEQKKKLAAAGVAADAEFLPNIDLATKKKFLASLTVLSVPATYGESFGLYVVEAMAAGVPVVQPRHGGFPEILHNTGGGLIVEPDDPVALADGLAKLIADEPLNRELGERGRRGVREHYSVERMAKGTLAVYESVTKPSPSPQGRPGEGGEQVLGLAGR